MLLGDLNEFWQDHQPQGGLTVSVGGITPTSYAVSVTCLCGVVFERWVTDVEAHVEKIITAWRREI